jgi:PAS domain S-box-containing protein
MTEPVSTILVVDDEEWNRDMLGRRLERAGYEVVLAEDGDRALAILDQRSIDLVLLDIMMPGLSGIDVLRRVRADPSASRIPIIMVTAKAQPEDVVEALELGADDYLTKPVNFPVAVARIRTQLARRRAELALSESQARYALAVEGTNDGVWDWQVASGDVYASPRWRAIMGLDDAADLRHLRAWFDRVHPDDAERVRGDLDEHVAGRSEHLECEFRIRHPEGYRWILARARSVRDPQGRAARVAGSVTDITEGKVADALTGLPNRVLFGDRLGRLFEQAKRVDGFQFAVLLLDLDHFKNVNDSLGHQAGDQLLVETAHRLERNLRSADSVARLDTGGGRLGSAATTLLARLGGDEFAIILGGLHHPTDVTRVADRLGRAIAQAYAIEGQDVFVTASIGIALSATGYTRPGDMLRDADTALYRAKAAGRGCFELFDAEMREQVVRRLHLETDMRQAVSRGELILHYQPIVALPSGTVTGVEALVRWQHPTRGLILPADFIPMAEETGLIVPIGYWVIEEACRQLQLWDAEHDGDRRLAMAVNLSVRQLSAADFVETTIEIVDRYAVDHARLECEITESVMITNPEAVRSVLERLRASGFRISIDDFGTGYSSLSHLQRFPADRLKIDRSLLQEIATQPESQAIMKSMVLLADHLQLEVVAEGIETRAQLRQVESLQCGFGQGYYFSHPEPAGRTPNRVTGGD